MGWEAIWETVFRWAVICYGLGLVSFGAWDAFRQYAGARKGPPDFARSMIYAVCGVAVLFAAGLLGDAVVKYAVFGTQLTLAAAGVCRCLRAE